MQERKVKMNAAIMEPSEWSKEEKKEKTRMMKSIFERHSEATSKAGTSVAEKENVVNLAADESIEDKV